MDISFLENQQVLWLTDLHVDMADPGEQNQLFEEVANSPAESLWITGDIAEGFDLQNFLKTLHEKTGKPVYFVLGNHDYYGKFIEERVSEMEAFSAANSKIHFLPTLDPIFLNDFALVGIDNFNDGYEGDFTNREVWLRDYIEIEDFIPLSPFALKKKLAELGEQSKKQAIEKLTQAFKKRSKVVLLIHVPPFRESCLYQECPADNVWAPHFVCHCLGEALKAFMEKNPDKELLVLCGHSHHKADYSPLDNLRVLTGEAEYGRPAFQTFFLTN